METKTASGASPSLATFSAAFALYIEGTAMEPRYFDGEILYCNPNRPLSNGCFVAIDLGDGQSIVRQLVTRDGDHLVLRQFNPLEERRLHVGKVKSIVRVTGSGDGE